jgi:hypothetical protein
MRGSSARILSDGEPTALTYVQMAGLYQRISPRAGGNSSTAPGIRSLRKNGS